MEVLKELASDAPQFNLTLPRPSKSYCQTPDQTKIKIQSNQKSGEALYLGSCLFVVCSFVVCRNAGYNRLIPF